MEKTHVVKYKLPEAMGGKEMEAGPYTESEANEHAADIRGYEGITGVYVTLYMKRLEATNV